MLILGYSGLDNAITYRKKNIQGLSNVEEKMCQGLDSAAALLCDGEIVAAAEEERFNLDKHTCAFPLRSIKFCLDEAKVDIKDLDFICHGFDFSEWRLLYELDEYSKNYYTNILSSESQIKLFQEHFDLKEIKNKFVPVRHHTAHAASAFYPSNFDKALVIVADGMGEVDSISIYFGEGKNLRALEHYNIFSSLGIFYSIITNHLGFDINSDEYKTMGLAPYGDPERFKPFFDKCIEFRENGEIFIPVFSKNKTLFEKQTYSALREWISQQTFPPRGFGEELTQEHKDFAAGLQSALNNSMLKLCTFWREKTGLSKLCMAGGVALNCVANAVILKSKLFDEIYIPPAAGDPGTALGAALYKHCDLEQLNYSSKNKTLPLYGPSFNDEDILKTLNLYKDKIQFIKLENEDHIKLAAERMSLGEIIAWMQGCMEFGPRALGNRSILADPRCPNMRDRINKAVKKRESFRPFAPSVKLEKAHIYFEIEEGCELPHMLFTAQVKDNYKEVLPAITHVDGSARIQTVKKDEHHLYWQLINEFEKETNIPIILNTSFNVKGQPIVCSPEDAVKTLLSTDIDALFIGQFYVTKLTKELDN